MSCCNGPRPCCNDYDHDREGVSAADVARFGGDDVSCPTCGADMYHDADVCPACGHIMGGSISKRRGATAPSTSKSPVIFVGLVLAIALALAMSML
jgi:predicted amidophosphoribosyltransferase